MIKVVAKHFVREEKINDFIEVAKKLTEETLKEDGCIKYELYQDEKYVQILTLIEEWTDEASLKNHMSSDHFRSMVPMINIFMEKQGEINIYKKLI